MNDHWDQYVGLRDSVLDGSASQEEINRLERLVLESDALKRDYTEHVHQQAALVWHVTETPGATVPTVAASEPANVDSHVESGHHRGFQLIGYLLSLAAAVLLTLGGTWLLGGRESSSGFAMIISTEDCHWGDCSLATAENHPLGPGRIRLQSGMATVRLPKVDVTLEGEVDFEIVNEKKCLLHSGRIFANVEPGGEGFVIQTPTAVFVDQGTTFGVNVLQTGTSDLKVFRGQVDVNHTATGNQISVKTDEHVRVSATRFGPISEVIEPAFHEGPAADLGSTRPVHISTTTGAGDDIYIAPTRHPAKNSSTTAILVKRPPAAERPGDWGYPWRRKAFLRFDLSLMGDAQIQQASLQLHGVQTNIGFASLIPDATFSVYGLIDESEDYWSSKTIDWLNCPATLGDKLDVDTSKTVLIGTFVVPQSNPVGRFEVGGDKLTDFLSSDTNGVATLIVIPETVGEGEAYVHGFASKRHPELPAPTLRLRVE